MNTVPLLEIDNLKTYFFVDETVVRAVDGISFFLNEAESLAIVGESGCGKSVTALSIMRLIQSPPAKIVEGSIQMRQTNILELTPSAMRKIRGQEIAMIFQDPMTSLNPVFTVGYQIMEAIIAHQKLSKKIAWTKVLEMMELVKIPDAKRRARQYPHQFSGGMRQRVMIAMALSCQPKILIADEPTTALDATVQIQILDLIKELQERTKISLILITHNLGIVANLCQRVLVMYSGKIVEETCTDELFSNPLHPYTQGLLECLPTIEETSKEDLPTISGHVETITKEISFCIFAPRCKYKFDKCNEMPPLIEKRSGHIVRCWL